MISFILNKGLNSSNIKGTYFTYWKRGGNIALTRYIRVEFNLNYSPRYKLHEKFPKIVMRDALDPGKMT